MKRIPQLLRTKSTTMITATLHGGSEWILNPHPVGIWFQSDTAHNTEKQQEKVLKRSELVQGKSPRCYSNGCAQAMHVRNCCSNPGEKEAASVRFAHSWGCSLPGVA